MKALKKLLYLLQLQEYQTSRYEAWLKRFAIQDLVERKNQLHLTARIIFTLAIALIIVPLLGSQKAVALANEILRQLFWVAETIIVLLAQIKLSFYPQLIKIVITGSYGKTTFKEMLTLVLAAKYSVLETPGNINTRLGIALTILRQLHRPHQILIVEAGAYRLGEIRQICQLIRPQFGVITIFGWMHLERFGNSANIRTAKMELIPFIKNKQRLFLPAQDHRFLDFEHTCRKIAAQLEIDPTVAFSRLKEFTSPEHRLSVRKINRNLTLLDDAYSSNPESFRRGLKELEKFKNYQKIIVTPGMVELGDKQASLNRQLAQEAAKTVDVFVIVGQTNKKALGEGARGAKIVLMNREESFVEKLTGLLRPPAVVLLENDLPDHYF